MKNRPFPAVDAGRIEIVPISEEKGEIIKVTNEIGENIPASKLIEDFFYVPLESIEESLFAYCNQIEVFEDKINLLEQKLEKKGIILRDKTLRDFVYADKSMVEIIIQNLLTNAIKFSKEGDTITIANHISNGKSIISISDTGVGISKENQQKLFKNTSFTTIGTQNEKGTGLGLTICKELVELNLGKIWVESDLNVGTTFYVELPKSNPQN